MRIGLLGAGYIAPWHVAAINRLRDARVTAVCDADIGRARRLAEPLGAAWYASIPELLEADACDTVHILLPPSMHAPSALQTIQSKKHVFLEKPMCLTSQDCLDIIRVGESSNVKVGVNHNFLCLPSVDKLSQSIRQKALGQIDHLTVDWMMPLGLKSSGAANSWLTATPFNAFLEVASHPLAFVAYLLDDVDSVTVHASDRVDFPDGKSVYARWQIIGETISGTGFTIRLSLAEGFPQRRVEARGFGGRATVVYDRDIFTLEQHSRHDIIVEPFLTARSQARQLNLQAWRNLRTQATSLDKLSPFGLSLARSIEAFYSTLGGPADPRISAELGFKVVKLAERCVAAASICPANGEAHSNEGDSISHISEVANNSASTFAATVAPEIKGRVLVFGGAGFIGRHLVRQVVDDGYEVAVVSRRPCPELHGYKDRVKVHTGSVHDGPFLRAAVEAADYAYHLARPSEARSWSDYVSGDIGMTRIIGEACCQPNIRRFVYTGTIDSYYSGGNDVISEATGLDPRISRRNLYARSKAGCEEVLKELQRKQGLALVIARPGIVLGSGGSPLHPGVGLWPSPTTCLLWGRGDNKLPFVLVEDVVAAMVRMLDSPNIEGEDYNLVGDPLLNARQYLAAYEAVLNCQVQVFPHEIWRYFFWDCVKNITKAIVRRGDARMPSYADWKSRSYAARYDNTKAKEHLNWRPTPDPTSLATIGIEEAVRHFFQKTKSNYFVSTGHTLPESVA